MILFLGYFLEILPAHSVSTHVQVIINHIVPIWYGRRHACSIGSRQLYTLNDNGNIVRIGSLVQLVCHIVFVILHL